MNRRVALALLASSLGFVSRTASAEVVGRSREFNGRRWYVDVQANGRRAKVWFRKFRLASSPGDFVVMELKAKTMKLGAARAVCTVTEFYDNGRAFVGCTSVIGAGVCAAATTASMGATAAMCTSVIYYTADRGALDCFWWVSDEIAAKLSREKEWAEIRTQVDITNRQWVSAIQNAIEAGCYGID